MNPVFQFGSNLLNGIKGIFQGSSKGNDTAQALGPNQQQYNQALAQLKGKGYGVGTASATPSSLQTPQPTTQPVNPQPFATPQSSPDSVLTNSAYPQGTASPYVFGQNLSKADLQRKIQEGYREYSGGRQVPMEDYMNKMVDAPSRFPAFAKNPFLIPAVSVVETSAGQNWKLNKNPISWAARVQQAGGYSPSSPDQAIEDMITAVGGDPNRGAGFDPQTAQNRMATESYYQPFRNTNNLWDFTQAYENSSGNPNYYPALVKALQMFERQK